MLPILIAQNAPQVVVEIPPAYSTPILIIAGIVLLLFGRSLYWAFVAIAGFLLGMALATHWFADQQQWVQILIAVLAGVVGAVLAIVVQRLAFAIGGFFAGGYLAMAIAARIGGGVNQHSELWMIIGGIIGAIVAAMIMDWAIIVLSSLAGSAAVLSPFAAKLNNQMLTLLFLVIAVVGIVIQGARMTRRVSPPPAAVPPA